MNVRYFVTGQGRSGTKWLATVLDCDPSVRVRHEALRQWDARVYRHIWTGKLDAVEYLESRRKKMEEIAVAEDHAEVNSYLRYCVPGLRQVFGVPVVGLVRDGRYVVRSMLARGVFVKKSPLPKPQEYDAFTACCWYWADTYQRFDQQDVLTFRLEDVSQDFDAFQKLRGAIGANVSRHDWRKFRDKVIHAGRSAGKPLDWTAEQKTTFRNVAGDVQERFGYPL